MKLGLVVVTKVSKEVNCRHCKESITTADFLRITIVNLLSSGKRISTPLHITCLSDWCIYRLEAHKEKVRKQRERRKTEGDVGGRPSLGLNPDDKHLRMVLLRRRSRLYHKAVELDIADPELDELYLRLVTVDTELERIGGPVAARVSDKEAERKLWYGKERVTASNNLQPGTVPQARLVPLSVINRKRRQPRLGMS